MIIVKLMGGLGNQMFQYAMGRRLAIFHNTELKLDTSFLVEEHPGCTPRRLELQNLNLMLSQATTLEITELVGRGRNPLLTCLVWLRRQFGMGSSLGTVYCESVYHYDSQYEVMSDHAYLDGYWQSERYIAEIESLLREEFKITTFLDERNHAILDRIKSGNSVSVHIRRGDYVTNFNAAQYHGTCGIDYYKRAYRMMSDLVAEPKFFVFSDDHGWARENLGFLAAAEFVGINGPDRSADDLRLMSNCRHHIIANSSFSWWGAWLGADPGKKVIAPARWYLREDIDTTHLCPASWFRL